MIGIWTKSRRFENYFTVGGVITLRGALGDGFIYTERVISYGDFFRARLVIELLYNKRGGSI